MDKGQVCVTINNEGRFYEGKEVVIIDHVKTGNKTLLVKALDGQTMAWYDPKNLRLVNKMSKID